ncbi:Unknown protein [Striga hermonthica]|uniref:Uncharacterized protein n=1 Tax=Striga hermonthica TaxID=68872 RepID=A0A9N7RDU4_STRHE|nr:Unknown protein [Striga hermonthica]
MALFLHLRLRHKDSRRVLLDFAKHLLKFIPSQKKLKDCENFGQQKFAKKEANERKMSSARSSARELRRHVQKTYLRRDGGMTTLGLLLKEEGIVIAADHPYDAEPNIFQLNHCMVATISGGKDRGRDTSSFTSLITSLQHRARHVTLVKDLVDWLASTISAEKEYYSSVGILIAVWNESERALYKVNGNGVITKNDVLATGSGSKVTIFVKQKNRFIESGMSIPDAKDLARRAICIVAYEAPHYGDFVSVWHLGSEGFQMLLKEDMEEFHSHLPCTARTQVIGEGW